MSGKPAVRHTGFGESFVEMGLRNEEEGVIIPK